MIKKASVVIITKNNQNYIGDLLKALAYQDFKNFEVIIVDLCSTDKTLANAKNFPVKAFRLGPSENISRALNLASQVCLGEIIFCLKGNVIPQNNSYINAGIKTFKIKNLALIFGPKFREHEAPIVKIINPEIWGGITEEIKIINEKQIKGICADAFAFKKIIWEKNHFAENEEPAVWHWSSTIMDLGYKISFNPQMGIIARGKTGLINFLREKGKINQQFRKFEERRKSELSH